jgi:hypothetical protein
MVQLDRKLLSPATTNHKVSSLLTAKTRAINLKKQDEPIISRKPFDSQHLKLAFPFFNETNFSSEFVSHE